MISIPIVVFVILVLIGVFAIFLLSWIIAIYHFEEKHYHDYLEEEYGTKDKNEQE